MTRLTSFLAALCLMALAAPAAAQQQDHLAQLPPLIDRELFFGDPEILGAGISPNGEFISFRKQHLGVMNIWVKQTDEPFEAARPMTADTTRPVRGYFWSQDSRYLLYVQDKGGNENFHVYAVNPRDEAEPGTGVPPALDLTPYGEIQARIYSVPEATPDKILVGLNDRDAQVHDVYRVDLNTGERELVLQNDENVAGWQTDLEGTVRLGIKIDEEGNTLILRVGGETLTEVYRCNNEESCGTVRFHKDGRRVYMITNKGDDVDLTRLVLFDPATGEVEFVESDPENQVDFGGAAFSDVTDELVATVYVGDRVRIYPKTEEVARDLEVLREKLPEGELSFRSSTEDENLTIVYVSRDVDPGSAYLYKRDTEEVELLYRSRPDLPSEHLAYMQPVRYTARDGLEIPAYLTIPRGVEARNLPVVVTPHGGPWARDRWGYDPYTQFLANRGYAVLQPNFRGSTGYGKAFLNAGNNEWGIGAMQHDITDGVRYLIDEGIADPDQVAIFGGSYGGYATLAGVAFTPDLYAAGVSYVGPSNLLTLLNSIPPYWKPIKALFDVRLGDPEDPADRERLLAQSPLFSAEQITAPLLVIQGANDPRVKKRESEQIVVALRDLGREVEYLLAEDEGHGFAGNENRLAVAVAMERFLAEHLQGRYQEETPEEIAATLAALTVDVSTVEVAEAPTVSADAATAPLPVADGSLLEPGTLQYAMTAQVMGQEMVFDIARDFETATVEGETIWRVVETTVMPMGTVVDTMELDYQTLAPIRRSLAGGASVRLHYTDTSVTGEVRAPGQTMPIDVDLEAPILASGAGTDAVIATLPLQVGYTATFRIFNVQSGQVRPMRLEVTGTEMVECAAGTFESYVVTVTPLDDDEAGAGTLKVMTAAPHTIVRGEAKLPASAGGGMAHMELTGVGSGGSE
jgi:dipeptidyl aminopeptidase/acylaminoacyl peptidase